MTVEALPLGFRCNIACRYCYQEGLRAAGQAGQPRYDLAAMLRTIDTLGEPFQLFGGEPLLVPLKDLETLWQHGLRRWGRNGIQTNGTLVTEAHMALFRAYRVSVGISIDGPGRLNDLRWAGTLRKTRRATAKSLAAIDRLIRAGMPPGLIVTLHARNGTPDRRPVLWAWLEQLASRGVRSVNLHPLEVDDPALGRERLSARDLADAWIESDQLAQRTGMTIEPVSSLRERLAGREKGGCTFTFCDPLTTVAVQGVSGDGRLRNCGRVYKDGVPFLKASAPGYERTLALYHTPQAYGGCAGCRFFLVCGGGNCPGTGEQGDLRGRTEHCEALTRLYEYLEAELVRTGTTPLSLRADREALEARFVEGWRSGVRLGLPGETPARAGDPSHGDHTDHGDSDPSHGDHSDHGDSGPSHGDHTDHGDSW